MNDELQAKIDYSINLLRRAEPMALRMSEKGFFLAFSGGKDSQCLYHIAKEAGVKLDQFNRMQEVEDQCMARFGKRDKLMIAPIIEWTDKDVWDFIHDRNLAYCKLYDEGWKRIGCLFCPMARKAEQQMAKERYPKYKAAIIRTIHKIRKGGGGYVSHYPELTDEQIFDWWTGKTEIKKYYAENYLQQKLGL